MQGLTPNPSEIIDSALFLFAHQDDEFGVFQKIIDEKQKGRKIFCAYLTSGVMEGYSSEIRNRESITVLAKLGVAKEDILFIGQSLSISDGRLIENLKKAKDWLKGWVIEAPTLKNIYLPAWEGGHPDHDSLHAIGVKVADELNILKIVWQFPLYNGYQCNGPFFRVFLPLAANGNIINGRIKLADRASFMRYIFSYPSQRVTWIGLSPFVLLHYIFYGEQSLQPVSVKRLRERPHIGCLYYERRKFSTWNKVQEKTLEFIEDRNL
jgi:LmbE family N-acetylglucosaminyl deacetylase